jgi:hypothetical protein
MTTKLKLADGSLRTIDGRDILKYERRPSDPDARRRLTEAALSPAAVSGARHRPWPG